MSGGVGGTICTVDEYQSSLKTPGNPYPDHVCLTPGQDIGLATIAETSSISFAAVCVVFLLLWRNVSRWKKAQPNGDWRLFNEPSDVYMVALFIFDLLQAMGGIMNAKWAHTSFVETGHYCTAQGVIQQLGECGVALTTLAITVHSVITGLWRVGMHSRGVAVFVVSIIGLFLSLWVGLGTALNTNYEWPDGYWCWIGTRFKGDQLGGEYVWLWIALFASFIGYVPLYLWSKGSLSVDEHAWYKFHMHNINLDQSPEFREIGKRARRMLYYPLAYAVCVLPLSIARWMFFQGDEVQSAGTFIATSIFNLSGAVNVLLLLIRPQLLLFSKPPQNDAEAPAEGSAGGSTANEKVRRDESAGGALEDEEEGGWKPEDGSRRGSISEQSVRHRASGAE